MKIFPSQSTFSIFILSLLFYLWLSVPCYGQHSYPLVSSTQEKNILGQSTVFGAIPKTLFPSGVLYNLGPISARDVAIRHDGRDFRTPPSRRQWRQTVFELDRNKLYSTTLPGYLQHIKAAEEYRWKHSDENRQPLLLADVTFEWLDQELTEYPQLVQVSKGTFKPRDKLTPSLPSRKNRFFSASLIDDTIHSRLVTFALAREFIFTNSDDPVTELEMIIGEQSYDLPMEGTITIDLGEKIGEKDVLLTATHVSNRISKAVLHFTLERLKSGKWSNTTIRDGVPSFSTSRLPVIQFRRPNYLNELLEGE